MREIFKIIKEHFVLLLGTGLFTLGLLSHRPAASYYHYQAESILLTIGVVFIVIGLLKIRKRKGEN